MKPDSDLSEASETSSDDPMEDENPESEGKKRKQAEKDVPVAKVTHSNHTARRTKKHTQRQPNSDALKVCSKRFYITTN